MIRLDLTPGERDALLTLVERWLRESPNLPYTGQSVLDVADAVSARKKLEAAQPERDWLGEALNSGDGTYRP